MSNSMTIEERLAHFGVLMLSRELQKHLADQIGATGEAHLLTLEVLEHILTEECDGQVRHLVNYLRNECWMFPARRIHQLIHAADPQENAVSGIHVDWPPERVHSKEEVE